MNTSASDPSVPPTNPTDPFRLRPDPPRVVRLSRKVLGGLAVITAVGIGGALIFALQDRPAQDRPSELFTTENRPTADELRRLPSDYSGIPQLGPALPGDLGRPILRTQDAGQPVPASPMPGPDPAEQRRLAEEEAARTSEVFFATQSPTAPSGFAAPSTIAPNSFPTSQPSGGVQTDQDRQLAFLNAPVDRRIVAPDRVTPPASPYVLQAGSVIPAALVSGIRSDLPGLIVAQIRRTSMTVRQADTSCCHRDPASSANMTMASDLANAASYWFGPGSSCPMAIPSFLNDSLGPIAPDMRALRTVSITIGAVY